MPRAIDISSHTVRNNRAASTRRSQHHHERTLWISTSYFGLR